MHNTKNKVENSNLQILSEKNKFPSMNTKFFTVSIIRLNTGQLGNQARALFSEYLNPSSLSNCWSTTDR